MKAIRRDIFCAGNAGAKSCSPVSATSRPGKLLGLFVSLIGLAVWGGDTLAAAKVASAGTNWATATWTPVGVPTATDTCTINSGINLTVNTAAVCGALNIGNNNSSNTTLTLAAGGSLNITASGGQSGNLVLNPNSRSRTFSIATGTQTLTVDGTFTTGAAGTHQITVSTGQVTFANVAGITWPTRGTLTITGNPSVGASVTFNGPVTQAGGTIQNTGGTASILTFNGGYTKSGGVFTTRAGETINFGGNLTMSGGATTFIATSTVNFTATATITPTSAITFGNLIINPGAGNIVTLAGNVSIAGNLGVSSGTFATATRTVTLNGTAAQTISGVGTVSFNNLTINNTANPNITLATNVTVSGTLTGMPMLTSTCPTDYTLTAGTQVWHSCLGGATGMNHVVVGVPASPTCGGNEVSITPHTYLHAPVAGAGTIYLVDVGGAPFGSWSLISGTGTFTPGAANSGTATYTFGVSETGVTLGYTPGAGGTSSLDVQTASAQSLVDLAESAANCPSGTNGTGCDLIPADNNFIVADALGNPIGIPLPVAGQGALLAGQTSASFYLKYLTATCSPRTNRTRTLEFGMVCRNPVNGTLPVTLSNGIAPTCNANGAPPTWGTLTNQISVVFDANALSPALTLVYHDVGQVEVLMQRVGTPTEMGTTGPFVVKPGGFVLSNIVRTSDNFANPASANAAGTAFVKAGEAFTATVTATTIAGVATPNFGQETPAASVQLQPALVAGLGLTNNPSVSGNFVSPFVSGVATGTNFTWPEVGIINLLPHVLGNDYLGGGDSNCDPASPNYLAALWCKDDLGNPLTAVNVGRFYPDHFDTEIVLASGIPMPCPAGLSCPVNTAGANGFVYSGQPFSVQVTARNVAGGTTVNYSGPFSKIVTLTAWNALGGATQNLGSGNLTNNAIRTARFSAGIAPVVLTGTLGVSSGSATVTGAGTLFLTQLAAGDVIKISGFEYVVLAIASDTSLTLTTPYAGVTAAGLTAYVGPIYTFTSATTAPTNIYIRADEPSGADGVSSLRGVASVEGGVAVVNGHIKVSNAYGSEMLPLTLIATAQYYAATGWVSSITDSVTNLTLPASYSVGMGSAAVTLTPSTGNLSGGNLSIKLGKPSGGATGKVTVNPGAPSYLPVIPGEATFGIYRGKEHFIYQREAY